MTEEEEKSIKDVFPLYLNCLKKVAMFEDIFNSFGFDYLAYLEEAYMNHKILDLGSIRDFRREIRDLTDKYNELLDRLKLSPEKEEQMLEPTIRKVDVEEVYQAISEITVKGEYPTLESIIQYLRDKSGCNYEPEFKQTKEALELLIATGRVITGKYPFRYLVPAAELVNKDKEISGYDVPFPTELFRPPSALVDLLKEKPEDDEFLVAINAGLEAQDKKEELAGEIELSCSNNDLEVEKLPFDGKKWEEEYLAKQDEKLQVVLQHYQKIAREEEYQYGWSWNEKTYWILCKAENATARAIADYVNENFPEEIEQTPYWKVKTSVGVSLGYLWTKRVISRKQDTPNRYIYSHLPEVENHADQAAVDQ